MSSDAKLLFRSRPNTNAFAEIETPTGFSGRVVRRSKILVLAGCALIVTILMLVPPLPQSPSYHDFADRRTLFGIRDFWDVLSNLPFLVVGLMGLLRFRDAAARALFFGVFCTSLGSAYYHLAPDNARLFWDRLPMTIAFMALFAIAINQRRLVIAFVFSGIGSVVWWRMTDNLVPYGFVQFGTMAALLVIAVRREPGLWLVFIFYALSKISEHFDQLIYSFSPLSGHTIKHLLAGIATLFIYRWIRASRLEPYYT